MYSKEIERWMEAQNLVNCHVCDGIVETTADNVGDDYEFYCKKHISEARL